MPEPVKPIPVEGLQNFASIRGDVMGVNGTLRDLAREILALREALWGYCEHPCPDCGISAFCRADPDFRCERCRKARALLGEEPQ